MSNQNESLNVSAKTVDEAIEQGLEQLGLTHSQVNIEIINEGKRTLFGLKSENATVRLTPKQADNLAEEAPVAESTEIDQTQTEETEAATSKDISQEEAVSTDDSSSNELPVDDELVKMSTEYLTGLLKRMGIKAEVKIRSGIDLVDPEEKPPLVLDVTGKDLGILIGRRNETLQALQYMVRLMISKQTGSWQSVVVDVESYRARRRQSLKQMANRMAERAIANDERVVLESMSAYERRLIHIALRDHPDVYTKSIGRDRNRKVTIIPK